MISLEDIEREISELESRYLLSSPRKSMRGFLLSAHTALDGGEHNSSHSGSLRNRWKPSNFNAISVLNAWLGTLFGALRKTRAIRAIVAPSTPFEVAGAIIRNVLVYMVYFTISIWICDKSGSNKPMNSNCLGYSIFINSNTPIAIFLATLLNHLSFDMGIVTVIGLASNPVNTSHIPHVGNLIVSFITNNIFPNFCVIHGRTSLLGV